MKTSLLHGLATPCATKGLMTRQNLLSVLTLGVALFGLTVPSSGADAATSEGAVRPAPLLPDSGEAVEVTTKDKQTLKASWYAPRKKNRQVPGVMLVHDAGADRFSMNSLAERLQKDGFAVLSLDLRGHGESKTEELDWSALDEDARKAQWAYAQRDVDAGVRWLLSQDNVHSTRLTLVGHGAGCALAVRHMRDDDNAIAVALLEPSPESFGFEVDKDLIDLEGLPTYVVAPRDAEEATEAMVSEANSLAGGDPFVELWLTRPPILEDRKTAAKVSNFLELHAFPKKGK